MNFLFFFIIIILLISTKIILFNEEFLIFISFISFFIVIYENFKNQIKLTLDDKIHHQELVLLQTLNLFHNQLKNKINYNYKFQKLKNLFKSLKIYYLGLNNIFNEKRINYLKNQNYFDLINKLTHFFEFENSYSKIIFFLLIKKIKLFIKLKLFFKNNLNIKQFKTINKLNLQEFLKRI